ncbi:AbiU2 domain-containing protein [Zavarzinella formosa]|uniref:AbiU2 domain-containing protein n=1 Tax=Zavarzinella formosa TaxID=360055 RepID=UPI0002F94B93|nr:hypothetical protein [Zavarzinella formosa]
MSEEPISTMPPEAVNEFSAIWHDVRDLHAVWKTYIDLYGDDAHLQLMNDSLPDVFWVIQKALRSEITAAHGRLFDSSESKKKNRLPNLSLERLIEILQPHSGQENHEFWMRRLDEARQHCEPILHWRNKHIGHSDLATRMATENLPRIDREQVAEGLRFISQIVNAINTKFNGRYTAFDLVQFRGRPTTLMVYVKTALDLQKARREGRAGKGET